jgi:hypothetical protein
VDLRAGLDDVEKRKFLTLPGLELRLLGRLARSQSLYQLRYPGLLPPEEYRIETFILYSRFVRIFSVSSVINHLRFDAS